MDKIYEKMRNDFSFLKEFGFSFDDIFFHWVTPGVIFKNENKKLGIGIYFSYEQGEVRFHIGLYKTTPVFKVVKNEKIAYFPMIASDIFQNDLVNLTNGDPDKAYAIQLPIVKKKLSEYLNELKKKGIV